MQRRTLSGQEKFIVNRLLDANKSKISEFTTYKQVIDFVKKETQLILTESTAKGRLKEVCIKLKEPTYQKNKKHNASQYFSEKSRKEIRTLARHILIIHKMLGVKRSDFENGNDQKNFDAVLRIAEAINASAAQLMDNQQLQCDEND